MVHKVEGYETHPESSFPVPYMSDGVEVGLDFLLQKIIGSRDLGWIEAHGIGQFEGLAEHVTDRFAQVVPKCDPNCRMHMEVQAYRPGAGDSDHVKLALECPLLLAAHRDVAQGVEDRCSANHQATRRAFEGFVISSVTRVKAAETVIDAANEQIAEAKRELDGIL
jgi:hypothetical protein